MIYKLSGMVDFVAPDFAVLDVQGVGYRLFCASRTLGSLVVGEGAQLYVFTNVKETEISLFGFKTMAERVVFDKLTDISGVGPKVGLAILNVLNPEEIANAIALQDHTPFTRASGVGPKLAQRLVMELKGKMGALPAGAGSGQGAAAQGAVASGVVADVVSALGNLGYKPQQAQQAVVAAHQANPEGGFDTLFKASLRELR